MDKLDTIIAILLVIILSISVAVLIAMFVVIVVPELTTNPQPTCTISDTLRIHFTNTPLGVTFAGCIRDSAIVWGELFKSWQVDSTSRHIVKCSIERHRLKPGDTFVLVVE